MNLPLITAALLSTTSPMPDGALHDGPAYNGPAYDQPGPAIAYAALVQQAATAPRPEGEEAQNPTTPDADAALVDADNDPADGTGDIADEDAIIVSADSEARKRDPLVNINETTFAITQDVDKAVVEPVAKAYKKGLPKPVRRGLRNFFRNLLEPVNFLNYLLQLKPGKAFETLGRFTINSTIGVAGLIDVAKEEPFNLPYRRNGFANTLGYYGVGPGPFLVVPLVGATSLRDFLGGLLDQAVLPIAVGKPFNTLAYAIPAYTVNSLEFRIEFDERLEAINESDDPYFALRETYLCQREADIAELKNMPPPRDCSLDALFSDGLDGGNAGEDIVPQPGINTAADNIPPASEAAPAPNEASPNATAPDATLGDATAPDAARVGIYTGQSGTVTGHIGANMVNNAGQAGAAIEELDLVALENGCALLQKGVNSFHVVTC